MTQNPILTAPAVREARAAAESVALSAIAQPIRRVDAVLDAYATAILAEVKRRVEALDMYTEFPDGLARVEDGLRDTALAQKWDLYLDRAAVLRILDGRDDA